MPVPTPTQTPDISSTGSSPEEEQYGCGLNWAGDHGASGSGSLPGMCGFPIVSDDAVVGGVACSCQCDQCGCDDADT